MRVQNQCHTWAKNGYMPAMPACWHVHIPIKSRGYSFNSRATAQRGARGNRALKPLILLGKMGAVPDASRGGVNTPTVWETREVWLPQQVGRGPARVSGRQKQKRERAKIESAMESEESGFKRSARRSGSGKETLLICARGEPKLGVITTQREDSDYG